MEKTFNNKNINVHQFRLVNRDITWTSTEHASSLTARHTNQVLALFCTPSPSWFLCTYCWTKSSSNCTRAADFGRLFSPRRCRSFSVRCCCTLHIRVGSPCKCSRMFALVEAGNALEKDAFRLPPGDIRPKCRPRHPGESIQTVLSCPAATRRPLTRIDKLGPLPKQFGYAFWSC